MVDNLSGGTTNLLRMARSGCQSAVAFVALASGNHFATASYPAELGDGPPSAAQLENLARQLWLEPGIAQGKALVRTVQLGGHQQGRPQIRLAVAVVPLGVDSGGRPSGILGVADPEAKSFGVPELELLSRIAQRLTSYVKARQAVRAQLAASATTRAEPSPPTPWGEAAAPAPDVGASAPVQPWEAGPEPGPARVVAAPVDVPTETVDPLDALLGHGSVEGLVPLGALLGRVGRLLGAGCSALGSLAVIVVTVDGVAQQDTGVLAELVRSLRTDLRFDDPVASIGGLSLVAVVPCAPGAASPDQVEARLVDRAREAVASFPGAEVRAAHVVAPLMAWRDADELLRAAVLKLPAG